MNVMLITGKYPPQPCGIGDHTYKLTSCLSHLGHRVSVLCSILDNTTEGDVNTNRNGVEAMREVSGWDFRNVRHILKVVRDKAVDVLHIQYQAASFDQHPMMTLLPLLVAWRSLRLKKKVKVVVTMHEFAGPSKPRLPRTVRRLWLLPLLLFSHAVVVTNERDLYYARKLPLLRNKVRLIPLGSNIEAQDRSPADKSIVRKKLGLDEGDILLVRFGFVDSIRVRQLDVLLYALKRVCERGYRVKMLFVGADDAESRAEIMMLAKSLGIDDRLSWTGFCPPADVSSYLSSADIGVFPFGDGASERRTSLLTAMTFGLPIVSTEKRFASVFVHGENILLVPPADPVSLADVIEELINKRGLRERLSANARRSSKQFGWEKIADATGDLYRSLVN
jgi:glycosyltransferase involved in cell wall biosynthesis